MSTENSNAAEPDGEDLGGDEGIDDSDGELSSVLIPRDFPSHRNSVGNQQKWDTFVKERSGGCGSIVGHPALPVVAFAPL